jgi:hypothetical protein
MSNKAFLRNLFIAGLTLSGARSLSSKPASAAPTIFQCIANGSGYATIAVADGKKTKPLITYNNRVFSGSGFTPQRQSNYLTFVTLADFQSYTGISPKQLHMM